MKQKETRGADGHPVFRNSLLLILFTVLLGAFAGAVVWIFLKAVSLCTALLWEKLPSIAGSRLLLLPACGAGGILLGLLHKRYGEYPESLDTVMDKVKREKYYPYHPMPVLLLCAFLPLVLGSSVGPEAGLTGIIAGLCYWVGDNVTWARQNAYLFSELGEAVTLGQLFHMPLFGILTVEESGAGTEMSQSLPRTRKLVFYGLSTAAGFLTAHLLTGLFGEAMAGFPAFSEVTVGTADYALLLLYIPVGFLLFLFFEKAETLSGAAADRLPAVVREGFCALLIAAVGLVFPIVLFSGEEQMAELIETPGIYGALFLMSACIVKLILTAFCIRFGLRGGHFFPLIFACVCMGYGVSMLLFADPAPHLAFAAAIVTASTLGAQLKKPLAVSVLMLLCFPARILFWAFLAAAVSGQAAARIFSHKTGQS